MTLENDWQESPHHLLGEIRRRLHEAASDEARAGVFAWAMEQGATITQIRDVFDAWENSQPSSKPVAAPASDGTLPTEEPTAPRPNQVGKSSSSIDDSNDSLEEPRPAGSI